MSGASLQLVERLLSSLGGDAMQGKSDRKWVYFQMLQGN